MSAPLRFLLLEDSVADAELVGSLLRAAGIDCDITVVETEREYLTALATHHDLVLSDHNLGSFDSRRALEAARRLHDDIPFIVVSGTMGEEAAIEALRAGATDYVLKSRLSRLVPCVQRALDEAAKRRQKEQVERELRRSEERYRELLAATTDMIWATDVDGRFTDANAAARAMTGFAPDEITGVDLASFLPADDPALAKLLAVCQGAPAPGLIRHAWRRRDGSQRTFESNVMPVVDDIGRPEGARGITRDITDYLDLEDQFRQAQRMEAIGTLAGGIAHDFNNALTTILGFTELLQGDEAIERHVQEELGAIRKAAEYSATLTRQLLAFSRRQVLAPVVLDLRMVIRELEKMLRRVIGENIDLEVAAPSDLPYVLADRGQIEQVLMNLAVNARDAMPAGGRLTIAVTDVTIGDRQVPDLAKGRYARLTVRDNGVGMPADVARRVFEPFFTTKPKGHGTGLGLSTVYGIVKQSGGHIVVESQLNVGTTFLVYLPVATVGDDDAGDRAPSGARRQAGGGHESILLVEDEDAVREFVRRTLQANGYNVHAVAGAEAARELLSRARPHVDLLLTDAVLRGESGPEFAAALKSEMPQLKVVFMSGYLDQGPAGGDFIDDAHGFLQKPFGPKQLLGTLREALDN